MLWKPSIGRAIAPVLLLLHILPSPAARRTNPVELVQDGLQLDAGPDFGEKANDTPDEALCQDQCYAALTTPWETKCAFVQDPWDGTRPHHPCAGCTECEAEACDWQCYLDRYQDVQNAYGATNTAKAEMHYRENGKQEGRDCTCPQAWAGSCSHGELISQAQRTQQDHCGECNPGYDLQGIVCQAWAGSCSHGELISQAQRTQQDHCGECNPGYDLQGIVCQAPEQPRSEEPSPQPVAEPTPVAAPAEPEPIGRQETETEYVSLHKRTIIMFGGISCLFAITLAVVWLTPDANDDEIEDR